MSDLSKTKKQLINELDQMRRRISELDAVEAEHKKVEKALRESEEKFRIASQIASDVVYERNIQTGIATFYGDIDSHLGYEPGEYPRTMEGWREHVHPKDLVWIDHERIDLLKPGVPYSVEYRMRKKDGTYMTWLDRIMLIRDEETGKPLKFIGAATNITKRKQAEKAVRESQEKLQRIFESVTEVIMVTDLNGVIIEANNQAVKLASATSKKEILGKSILESINLQDKQRASNSIQMLIKDGITRTAEFALLKSDGSPYPGELSVSLFTDAAGKPIGLVSIIRDITEQKKMEEERMRIEKLESIKTLSGGIAHDFNNLLTCIMGNISLARRNVEHGAKAFEELEDAEKATLKASDLTQQLLTFSKGSVPIRKTISIGSLIKDATKFTLRGSKTRPEFSLPRDLWTVKADEGQINQVICNIVINADQAMPQGGVINIEAKNQVFKSSKDLPQPSGNYAEIIIKDNGIGIPKEHYTRIFDPYFTTKQEGSGLGLATANSIVRSHGGYINFESEQNVGTTFRIYLPASGKAALKKEKITVKSPLRGKGKILIMDDEELIRNMLSKMLNIAGYDVEITTNGAEATTKYIEAKESGQPYDAVIMDLTIPGGMGGKEAIPKLLETDPDAKVIVSSGYSTDPIISKYREYGFSAVIAKPYSVSQLEETLYNILKKKE